VSVDTCSSVVLDVILLCVRSFMWVLSFFISSAMGLFRQMWASRVKFVRDMVKNGTHVLLTDVDAVFSRHVDPVGFVEEGYDVYHAYEMRYPKKVYHDHGFVINGGQHFFRRLKRHYDSLTWLQIDV